MLRVVAASPAVDRSYALDALTLGAIHRPASVAVTPGGKACNVARVAAALGARVSVAAALGGDAGRWVARELRAEGVALERVEVGAETRTCVTVIPSEGALTEIYEVAAPLTAAQLGQLGALALAGLGAGDWLVLAGSWPGEPACLAELCTAGRRAGAQVAIDTSGDALSAAVASRPDVVKVNRVEAASVTRPGAEPGGAPDGVPRSEPDAELEPDAESRAAAGAGEGAVAAAQWLAEATGGLAVVTDGAAGAYAASGGRSWRVGVPSGGPYPVGSGDAFLAGLLCGLDARKHRSPAEADGLVGALALAAGAASANALVLGAGRCDPALARELAGAAQVSPL